MSAIPGVLDSATNQPSDPGDQPIRVVIRDDGVLLELDGCQHHLDADEADIVARELMYASRVVLDRIEVRIAN